MKLTPTMQKLNPNAFVPSEATRKASARHAERSERESQSIFAAWLRQNAYEFINPPMFKKSAIGVGMPDFILASKRGLAIGIEFKQPAEKLRPEQVARHQAMIAAGWHVRTVFSAAEAIQIMRGIEL